MTDKIENPAGQGGAPKTDLAGASINSDCNVVRFRKQALRVADAVAGQLIAINEYVVEYECEAEDLLGIAEVLVENLRAQIADDGDTPNDRSASFGTGVLGAIASLYSDSEGDGQ